MDREIIDRLCEQGFAYKEALHLVHAVRMKRTNYNDFLRLIMKYVADEHTRIKEVRHRDGSISLDKYIYKIRLDSFITISRSGFITETGGIRFVEVMKKYGVRIERGE